MSFFADIAGILYFALVYVGSPICNFSVLGAAIAGFVGLVAFCWLAFSLIVRRQVSVHLLVLYLSFGLFSIGSGLLTGPGRLHYGFDVILSRDWKIFATPLWIAVVVLLYLSAHLAGARKSWPTIGLLLVAVLSLGVTTYEESRSYAERHVLLSKVSASLEKFDFEPESDVTMDEEAFRRAKQRNDRSKAAGRLGFAPYKQLAALQAKMVQRNSEEADVYTRLEFLRKHKLANFN